MLYALPVSQRDAIYSWSRTFPCKITCYDNPLSTFTLQGYSQLQLSNQAKGLLITTAGVLAFTPDTLLIRLLEMDRWALLFSRGIIIAAGLTTITWLGYGKSTPDQFRQIGKAGLLVAALFTCSTTCFLSALYFTSVANTLVILSGSSMFAALYSRFFLQEPIHLRTIATMIIVIGAIGYIVSDSLGSGSLLGDMFAVCASMTMAGAFTVTRNAKSRNMIPATAVSGLFTAAIAFFPADFVSLDLYSTTLLGLLGLTLTAAFALVTIGPRYISAPEVSLLLPIETVLGPFFIWLVLGEQPSAAALFGGAVVILALTTHSLLSLRDQARTLDRTGYRKS